ncbi:MAG: hypothetical protein RIA69_03380 [Cyclobacteriaceae bacterium]
MKSLEEKFISLRSIPERQWFERRKMAKEIIQKEVDQSTLKFIRVPTKGSDFLLVFSFKHNDDSFIYFEEITPVNPPVIHWFQLEKRKKNFKGVELGQHMIFTELLLSSDDQAKTQGGMLYTLLDRQK